MTNTKRIGNIGEAYALAKLVELGIPVYQQFGDNENADYIILVDNKPLKIQVKTSESHEDGKVKFDLVSSTSHRVNGVKRKYTIDEVDAFICCDARTKELFLVKNNGNMSGITIRYTKPKNSQIKNVNYFADFFLCVETLHEISR